MSRARLEVPENGDAPFLLIRSDPTPPSRVLLNLGLSLGVHLLLFFGGMALPEVARPARAPVVVADVRNKSVKLVAPRFTDLTQKDANKGKVSRSVDVRSAVSAPQPSLARIPTPTPAPAPPAPAPAPTPVILPEAPRIEVAGGLPAGGNVPDLPPAPKQTEKAPEKPPDKPKLAFETVASASVRSNSPNPALSTPRESVQDLARAAARPGAGGGMSVGDELGPLSGLGAPGQSPAPGRMGSNLQLLSDSSGVDFKPYLIQVLTAVRHNWMSVIPESARLGRQGVVLVQFIVDRQGRVPKLVIASPSGTAAFDRAAVAGVSMSHPFPPLPAGYKGDEVRLQLAFSYNAVR